MLYTPDNIKDFNPSKALGAPGEYPFTRGIYPDMYCGKLWTMRQYAGYGTAKESNRRYKYLLEQGQTGLSVAFDLPTQMGYDSDAPISEGEVGRCGVAIDSVKDMETLFNGIPLDKVSTSMTINSTAGILLAMYIVVAEKQGVAKNLLSGTVQNDILKEYIARGTYIFPPAESMRLAVDIFEYCSKHLPKWNTISISGYHIREAGATAVQELAFTTSNAIAYVESAIARGLDVDSFAPRLSFFFNAHNNFLEEIAKFRAGRRLWAKIMKERFNAKDPRSLMLRFHTQTAGCTLTAQQVENNAIRVAFQALSAVLGGTQSLHTNSMDEALNLPTEESVRLALRTQQIIAYESGVSEIVDPLGGSYCIENMTNEIEKRAMEYIEKVDSLGGAIKAIEAGFFQQEIHNSAYKYQKEIEEKKRTIVGVNKFLDKNARDESPSKRNFLRVDPKVEKAQILSLQKLKKERDNSKVNKTLATLKSKAESRENLIPFILECVASYATIGEICNTLKEVLGEYKERKIF